MLCIPPRPATRPEDPGRLADRRYIAEPKLDGQRGRLHGLLLSIN
jgi:ATP-dependent DNA ligase